MDIADTVSPLQMPHHKPWSEFRDLEIDSESTPWRLTNSQPVQHIPVDTSCHRHRTPETSEHVQAKGSRMKGSGSREHGRADLHAKFEGFNLTSDGDILVDTSEYSSALDAEYRWNPFNSTHNDIPNLQPSAIYTQLVLSLFKVTRNTLN